MTWYLSNRDGDGKTSEEGHYKFQTAAFGGATLESTSLQVTQNSPTGMSVLIAPGNFKIDTTGYSYTGWNSGSFVRTGFTADPANPRISSVVVYVDLSESTSASPPNNPGIIKTTVVNGTPGASPTAPSSGTIQTEVGATNPYIVIATVYISAAATTITNSNITDTRTPVYIFDNLVNSTSIKDSSVTTAKFADLSVTNTKLAANSVTTSKVTDGAVTDAKWRNGIAFYARRTASRSVSATTFTKLACDTIELNIGSGYSNSSDIGRFTAPVTGLYMFGASVNAKSPNNILSFYKNGSSNESRVTWVSDGRQMINGSRALPLTAGDYIEPYCYLGTAQNIATQNGNAAHITEFWGYLITRA